MKKLLFFLLGGMLCLLFFACKKQVSSSTDAEDKLISDAKAYFTNEVAHAGSVNPDNYRALQPKTVLWDQAYGVSLSVGKGVVVPVEYRNRLLVKTGFGGAHSYNLNGFTRLLIYTDAQLKCHAQLVTSLPDSLCLENPGKGFTGTILVEDWQGDHIADYLFQQGKAPLKYTFGPASRTAVTSVVVSCNNVINGYNYPADDPDAGYSWSEPAPCTSMYLPDDQVSGSPVAGDYAGGSSGGSNGTVSTVNPSNMIVYSGNSPISNVPLYIHCFQNDNNVSSYSVTLYIREPIPGSRSPYNYNPSANSKNPVDAGHTFLVFQQSNSQTTIRRAMGFYPQSWVAPIAPSSPGSLNDDENQPYTISLTITVTGQQFMEILNTCSTGNTVDYDLDNMNCTTFSLASLHAGGINISTTPGTWPMGGGDDPGDLGEDVRYMQLAPNMTRSLASGNAPLNNGTCN